MSDWQESVEGFRGAHDRAFEDAVRLAYQQGVLEGVKRGDKANELQMQALRETLEKERDDAVRAEREACARLVEPGGDARGLLETHADRRELARLVRARGGGHKAER